MFQRDGSSIDIETDGSICARALSSRTHITIVAYHFVCHPNEYEHLVEFVHAETTIEENERRDFNALFSNADCLHFLNNFSRLLFVMSAEYVR